MKTSVRLLTFGIFALLLCSSQAALVAATPATVEEFRGRVVRVRGLADGYGWIAGVRGSRAYIVTANHVIRNEDGEVAKAPTVEFFDDQGNWHPATALMLFEPKPQDLAVLTAEKTHFVALGRACAMTDLENHRLEVWFVGRDKRWYMPPLPGAINTERPTVDHLLKVDINTVRPGSSGAPLLTEAGLIGMLVRDAGASEVDALSVTFIRDRFKDWQLPWLLAQCPAENGSAQIQSQRMSILFNINPLNQREGEPTRISVKVRSDTGKHVSGAAVTLTVPGGKFERSASSSVGGRTDSDGTFLGVWRSQIPGAGSYTATAVVTKQGFNHGRNSITFQIHPKR